MKVQNEVFMTTLRAQFAWKTSQHRQRHFSVSKSRRRSFLSNRLKLKTSLLLSLSLSLWSPAESTISL